MRNSSGVLLGTQVWTPVKIGGLGYVTGMAISADGTLMLARTDVGGAYRRESGAAAWTQIITSDHIAFPTPNSQGRASGVYGIASAPSDPAKAYMCWRDKIWRSTNRAVDWADDNLNGATGLYMVPNNGNSRLVTNKLVVDPSNPEIVYFGSPNDGLWRRLSSGWANIASIPAALMGSDSNNIIMIAIDPTSALVGSGADSRRSVVTVSSAGNGVYQSTDGGTTFSRLADTSQFSAGSPISCTTTSGSSSVTTASTTGLAAGLVVSGTGIPADTLISSVTNSTTFVISNAATASGTNTLTFRVLFEAWFINYDATGKLWLCVKNVGGANVWNYSASSWSNLTMTGISSVVRSLRIDPKVAASQRIVGQAETGCPIRSLDGGSTWKLWNTINQAASATDIPIIGSVLNATFGSSQSASFADVIPHPTAAYDYVPMGLGVCRFGVEWPTIPSTSDRLIWQEFSAGIEELVGNGAMVTPAGDTILLSQDKAIVRQVAGYPAASYPIASLSQGHNVDWAIDDHNFLVGRAVKAGSNASGYSPDGGRNWTQFASFFSTLEGGSIAISNTNQIVVAPGSNRWPRWSNDNGATWNDCVFAGFSRVADGTENGFGFSDALVPKKIIAADKDVAGVFYIYNYGRAADPLPGRGLWKSTDGGQNFTKINSFYVQDTGFSSTLICAQGDLYIATGNVSAWYQETANTEAYKSTDGGLNWTILPQLNEVYWISAGKVAPGASYPTLYAYAWKGGVQGFYRSLDAGQTWTLLQDNSTFDFVNGLAGDPNIFGRFIASYMGTGHAESRYRYPLRLKAA